MSFEWLAPSAGTFTFSTVGSSFDTVLVIASYYSPSSVLACAGSVVGTDGESTSLNLSSGRRLLVSVCMNGPLAGRSGVGSGECYATCDNGTWVN